MTRLTALTVAVTLGLAFGGARLITPASAAPFQAAQEAHEAHHPPAASQAAAQQPQSPQQPQMPMMQMMQMHQKMMADMKAADDRLSAMVAEMKSATGQGQISAIVDVVAAMVEQRSAMHDRVMGMQCQMMGQMMQHMSGGMSPDMQKMMSGCQAMPAMTPGR